MTKKGAYQASPCRTRAVYLRVGQRRYGVEVESRRKPRYVEVRLILPSGTRLWTHHGVRR